MDNNFKTNDFKTLSTRLKRVNDNISSVANNESTIAEALETFRQISEEYSAHTSNEIEGYHYSNVNFDECSPQERENFMNDQLQMIECLLLNSVYEKKGLVWNWCEILKLMRHKDYAHLAKDKRKVMYSTSGTNRPIGEMSYSMWNGFQVIDIDIKNRDLALALKPKIFNLLCKCHWFLGVALSASGKSLHVWTKITPISLTPENKKIEFLCNFRHKFSNVYTVLSIYSNELGYTKENILEYMDKAMAKPQQGAIISGDNKALISTNFIDTRLDVDFVKAIDNGVEAVETITHKELKDMFAKLDWFAKENNGNPKNVEISNVSNINERDKKKSLGKCHYKHAQRWQLANTLTSLYGQDKAYTIMCEICSQTSPKELAGDVRTAAIHNKPVSLWAIKELNKQHGFNIKIKTNNIYEQEIRNLEDKPKEDKDIKTTDIQVVSKDDFADPIKALNDSDNPIIININHKQYLSDIKDQIIDNLTHINLLEAGAGYGKTEMIKALKSKTLLILPFTSTIKAKIEASEVTKDWLFYYGAKKPTIEDIMSDKSISMTIDKFAGLNIMELDYAEFKYIVIDESHLLFTSSYRDVMAPAIQRLANCKARVIMMTGTPTAELLFFPNITHIKVIKEDYRQKEFDLHMCPTKNEQILEMCRCMGDDIIAGKKILFPTNKGNLWFDQITGWLQMYLNEKGYAQPLKAFYYKKSNFNDSSMDNININKSIGDNHIVFCTNYLSVGVDICDDYRFSVYFNETWIPQDIEQFANRLRNNDLFIKMFLPKEDSTGMPINYYNTQRLDLSINKEDMLFIHDMIRACNDMIERNEEESKYNPIIYSMISANKFLKYDENDCKYYIDETQYKLNVFEDRYARFSKQLEVMLNGMRYYGYHVGVEDHKDKIDPEKIQMFESYLKECRSQRFDYYTTQTFKFLDTLNDETIDLYKNIMKGDYSIFKADHNSIDVNDRIIYGEDIEVIEKNIPIVAGLYRYYDCETIKDIYKYCVEKKSNKINYTKLDRIRRFIVIEANRKRSRIDFPVLRCIKDMHDFASANPKIDASKVVEWLQNTSAKYANTIKDTCVDDVQFLKSIYNYVDNLWKTVIVQGRPSGGKVAIEPFKLLWTKKHTMSSLYEGSMTSEFFIDELMDNVKDSATELNGMEKPDNEIVPEFDHTSKVTLTDLETKLNEVVHSEFDYTVYADKDGSNNRFLRKQENTNPIRETFVKNDHGEYVLESSYMESAAQKKDPESIDFTFEEAAPF